MTWDARICPDGHIGNAKRCACGKPTTPWNGELTEEQRLRNEKAEEKPTDGAFPLPRE